MTLKTPLVVMSFLLFATWMAYAHDEVFVVKDVGTVPFADHYSKLPQQLFALLRANPQGKVAAIEARLEGGKSTSHVRFLYDREKHLLVILMRTARDRETSFYHVSSYVDTDPEDFRTHLPIRAQKGYPKISQSSDKAAVTIPVEYAEFPKLSDWP